MVPGSSRSLPTVRKGLAHSQGDMDHISGRAAGVTYLLDPGSCRGLISRIYIAMKEDRVADLSVIKGKWEDDLPTPLTERVWKRSLA